MKSNEPKVYSGALSHAHKHETELKGQNTGWIKFISVLITSTQIESLTAAVRSTVAKWKQTVM